jgi:hypothetical protein
MKPELIVMLTRNDVTVPDAKEIFLKAKDAAATHWGFKVEGATPSQMAELAGCMKENGKRVHIECLALDEATCLRAAQLSAQYSVDHLLGTVYYESVQEVCQNAGIAYSPFAGLDVDARLRGTVDEIVDKAIILEQKHIFGIAISGFRYVSGDPAALLSTLDSSLSKPFISSGSVSTYERIDFLKTLKNLYGFTVGSAFFENKFGGTFADQINSVCAYLQKPQNLI